MTKQQSDKVRCDAIRGRGNHRYCRQSAQVNRMLGDDYRRTKEERKRFRRRTCRDDDGGGVETTSRGKEGIREGGEAKTTGKKGRGRDAWTGQLGSGGRLQVGKKG